MLDIWISLDYLDSFWFRFRRFPSSLKPLSRSSFIIRALQLIPTHIHQTSCLQFWKMSCKLRVWQLRISSHWVIPRIHVWQFRWQLREPFAWKPTVRHSKPCQKRHLSNFSAVTLFALGYPAQARHIFPIPILPEHISGSGFWLQMTKAKGIITSSIRELCTCPKGGFKPPYSPLHL